MTSKPAPLAALGRIARIKADLELESFAAIRRQRAALDAKIDDLQEEMTAFADGAVAIWSAPDVCPAAKRDSLEQTRMAHALTRQVAHEREAAHRQRNEIIPRFDAARAQAARAFGRAQALDALQRQLNADRHRTLSRQDGTA